MTAEERAGNDAIRSIHIGRALNADCDEALVARSERPNPRDWYRHDDVSAALSDTQSRGP